MKKSSIFVFSLSFALVLNLFSCTVDDEGRVLAYNIDRGGKPKVPSDGVTVIKSLSELPSFHGGNSKVVTHKLKNGEVNYTVEFDKDKQATRWVAFQMNSHNVFGNIPRYGKTEGKGKSKTNYLFDPKFSSTEFLKDLIKGSGYSHGHLIASADRKSDEEAQKQTFYLTNMAPQIQNSFNASPGAWALMEELVRSKFREAINVSNIDTMFVVRGCTIDNPDQIKENVRGLIVPKYFYSLQVLKYKDINGKWSYKALSFWIEHKKSDARGQMKTFLKPIREIEKLTGINFFARFSKEDQDYFENMTSDQMAVMWNIK